MPWKGYELMQLWKRKIIEGCKTFQAIWYRFKVENNDLAICVLGKRIKLKRNFECVMVQLKHEIFAAIDYIGTIYQSISDITTVYCNEELDVVYILFMLLLFLTQMTLKIEDLIYCLNYQFSRANNPFLIFLYQFFWIKAYIFGGLITV